ncbi:DUF3592 domain-containing protein [Streptomyces sp. NPDC004549]|uniref:DUF3592 domain-containing protein n=1 Tax=Streptomyces sp. NPDC004549 TaxID=3154283 RepID=UPI0033B7BB20
MDLVLYVIPSIMIALCVFLAAELVRRSRRVSRTWAHGLTAEGRCLNTYTTTGGGRDTSVHTTLHHVYEFTTREGRTYRFDETDGSPTVVAGDHVAVRYLPEHPEGATALAPQRGRLALVTGVGLGVLGAVVVGCAVFMGAVHETSANAASLLP